jgi:hypothetical protein
VRVGVVICLALAGCRSLLGIEDPTVGDGGSPHGDTGIDARSCFGVAPRFEICLSSVPTNDRKLVGTINTDQGCDEVVAGNLCVVSAGTIGVAAEVQVTGSRGLVIVAATTLMVTHGIDAAGHGAIAGPGVSSDATLCPPGMAAVAGISGGGGGAGGSFTTAGGNGGGGNAGLDPGASPGAVAFAGGLRAGCTGSQGAAGNGAVADPGGGGGGLIYLLAGTSMQLATTINASGGGGGRGNASKSGGSGGGSGGMIVLWSPTITGSVSLIANGGGGGGGADNGAPGMRGGEATGLGAAPGGAGGSQQVGRGGPGSSDSDPGGDGTTDQTGAGGGGGGGGGGMIRLLGERGSLLVQSSPPEG